MLFNGQLYEHTDGVTMGSPLGSLLANVFVCSIKETLKHKGKMSTYYRRYVDDTLRIMHDKALADNFLQTHDHCHSSVTFTMETEKNGMLLFLDTQLLNKCTHTETNVYVKPKNAGFLLQYKSQVNDQYKYGLLKTTLDHAFRLSSNTSYFSEECDHLKLLFSTIKYLEKLIDSTITWFIALKVSDQSVSSLTDTNGWDPVPIVLPFKDQAAAYILQNQLKDLNKKVHTNTERVFVSHKIEQDLKLCKVQPPVVQCLVYKFKVLELL